MGTVILGVDGSREPPSAFVKQLKRFDPELRIRWGMGQAVPFPGWIIERHIPPHMRKRNQEALERRRGARKPNWSDDGRYADQVVVDSHGDVVLRRAYDMMPEWWEVYRVMDANRQPVLELGEFVIDFLRQHYESTLLGIPELAVKERRAAAEEAERRKAAEHAERLDIVAEEVHDHRFEIFKDVMAFGGQPRQVFKENHEHSRESSGEAGQHSPGSGGSNPEGEDGAVPSDS